MSNSNPSIKVTNYIVELQNENMICHDMKYDLCLKYLKFVSQLVNTGL